MLWQIHGNYDSSIDWYQDHRVSANIDYQEQTLIILLYSNHGD